MVDWDDEKSGMSILWAQNDDSMGAAISQH
jgi:hypothetical protein